MVSPQARAEREKIVAGSREEKRRFPQSKPVELRRREWEAEARLVVLPPGTRFEDVPEDWVCPECGSPKSAFEEYTG